MKKELSPKQSKDLLDVLKARFDNNKKRHEGLEWSKVEERLKAYCTKLWSLYEMEKSGGEPDVCLTDTKSGAIIFFDCSVESPAERRNVCYDQAALDARKEHKPKNSAVAMAESMGVDLLTEEQYRHLQNLGSFDSKTSSWVKTPPDIRKLGGAIFCDRRYNTVFVYHNGAQSYYAARGFRAGLTI